MAGPCDPQKKKPRLQRTKNTMPIGMATSRPISIPTSIAASFSGLAPQRSKQRRCRSVKDVSVFPSCSGGPEQVSSSISSPISFSPYFSNTVPICERYVVSVIGYPIVISSLLISLPPSPRLERRPSIVGTYQILIMAIAAPLVVRQTQFLELVPPADEQHRQILETVGRHVQLFQRRPHSALGGLRDGTQQIISLLWTTLLSPRATLLPSATVYPGATYLGRHRILVDPL